jgi:cellulose synthase/poly-beta-1,6-N-acetylglucosamine synthase-like glycosyltransferase
VIRAIAANTHPDYEIIIVNDGSADATAEIADELARTYPHVRVIHHPTNRVKSPPDRIDPHEGLDLLHGRRCSGDRRKWLNSGHT